MNKVFLTGNLTKDTELNHYGSTSVAKNAIAVTRSTSKGKDNETDFFNVTAFGSTADFLNRWFSKGSRVFIVGRLQTSNYTDKNGNKKSGFDVIIENIEFGDSKRKAAESNYDDDGKPYEIDAADMPF